METRICQNCKKDFTIEPDDFSFYEKIKVPAPTFCPECFKTSYSPDRPEIIYCEECYKKEVY